MIIIFLNIYLNKEFSRKFDLPYDELSVVMVDLDYDIGDKLNIENDH